MKTVSVYWKRGGKDESVPKLSAFQKENVMKEYLGTAVQGGQKYTIPDIEENYELVSTMGGKWGKESPAVVVAEVVKKPGRKAK